MKTTLRGALVENIKTAYLQTTLRGGFSGKYKSSVVANYAERSRRMSFSGKYKNSVVANYAESRFKSVFVCHHVKSYSLYCKCKQ